jgi:prepilin-type N-terminal cleavage/methylation domain-containing protein
MGLRRPARAVRRTAMRTRAFTLIELLVVIAVIALLMGILMPALRAARDHAKRVHCLSNIRTLNTAWQMYITENDDKMPGAMIENSDIAWVRRPAGSTVEDKLESVRQGTLHPYVGDTVEVYRCPADARIKDPSQFAYRSFSIANGANGENWPGTHEVARKFSEIPNAASKYIFLEDPDPRGSNVGSWNFYFAPPRFMDPVAMWHGQKTTLGFGDGHAEMHKWVGSALIEWCETAMYEPDDFPGFSLTPPDDEQEDLMFMVRGFPCKSHD